MPKTGGRKHSPRTASAPVLSGELGDLLERHVRERLRHFFLSLFAMKALTDLMGRNHATHMNPAQGFDGKASHQIDSGDRSTDSAHARFEKTDGDVLSANATAFRKMDAAHFCNLGLKKGFEAQFRSAAATDGTIAGLLEFLEIMLGNTMQLPQKVNITIDRRIDALHAKLASGFLGGPPITDPNQRAYVRAAQVSVETYVKQKESAGESGYAEVSAVYLGFYEDSGAVDTAWRSLKSTIREEINARRELTMSDYVI